ncbi:hypothetical protein [Flavisolibacter tropicus]|uniref:Uncharacterized protein n=1 Tax=Flavisolibacter tropicus TaxID=1492898 RepID=A0A172TQQ5_9BACT|nr:hypothetical protein [Flavisolibacter tropicus]ANE49338.1 hypothetical protein SY85_01295 [Flavisolibacter tropicus]
MQAPQPRQNEQDIREQVKGGPTYEGKRKHAERDGERARQDEAKGASHIKDKGHNLAAAEGRINRNKSQNIDSEAQNINDADGRPLTDEEAHHARFKAGQGRQKGSNK